MTVLRGALAGAGYFSAFHLDAWSRLPGVRIEAVCDVDAARASERCAQFAVPRHYRSIEELLDRERPDFLDIVTPPDSHFALCTAAAARGIPIVCQKPLALTGDEAQELVEACAGVRLMVHDNFRFQPWHRTIRTLLAAGTIGRLFSLSCRTRLGDGWGPDAYRSRQPYFRTMPRLLVHETGIHFIDTFRFLAGEIDRVHAILRRLNPDIAGEDCALVVFEFSSGAIGTWDANRYNEADVADPRYTFGTFLLEGEGGTIHLAGDATLSVQRLGEPARVIAYETPRHGFAGDCVQATCRHFIDRLRDGQPFETEASAYLRNIEVEEAIYASSQRRLPVSLPPIA